MTEPAHWVASVDGVRWHYTPPQQPERHNANSYLRTACGRRMNAGRSKAADVPEGGMRCRTCSARVEPVATPARPAPVCPGARGATTPDPEEYRPWLTP